MRIHKILTLFLLVIGTTLLVTGFVYAQAEEDEATAASGYKLIGAGMAIGLAGLGAGVGMGTASAAAIGAMAEKPETFSKSLIYIVFIEAIAIYGLVIAFMIMMA
ncbi:ATP synthase subunit C [[Eubacterium] cellulosolvens]